MLLGHPVADLAVILKKLPTGTLIQDWLIVYLLLPFSYFIYFHVRQKALFLLWPQEYRNH